MSAGATFRRSETDAIARLVAKRRADIIADADAGTIKPSVAAMELATLEGAMAKMTDATT